MIIYSTKDTISRYEIKMPDELRYPVNNAAKAVIAKEQGDKLLEWGAKAFEFDGRQCMQITNYASRFTLFFIDMGKTELHQLGQLMAYYMNDIYMNDSEMKACIEKMFKIHPAICHTEITDMEVVTSLIRTQLRFAHNGRFFYNFVMGGKINTCAINKLVNQEFAVIRDEVDGEGEMISPADLFREMVVKRFGE